MNNKDLMTKVIELDTQKLNSREQSMRVMVQIAIIRKSFGVKNAETEEKVLNYERKRVLSNEDIEKEFSHYTKMFSSFNNFNQDKAKEHENRVHYFIEGVRFFDKELAESFTKSFDDILKGVA